MIHQERLQIHTSGHGQVQNLTSQVRAVVARSHVSRGLVHIFNVGSTAAVGAMEFEPGLCEDLPHVLDGLLPPSRTYGHERTWHDGNGHSHLQATLLGPSLTVPVSDGEPVLGNWQQIVHLECDVRARQREIVITVSGDSAAKA